MDNFNIKEIEVQDFDKYSDFFSSYKSFNELNEDPRLDKNLGIFDKVRTRESEKLVLYKDQPVFYIKYKKNPLHNKILSLILEENLFNADYYNALIKYLDKNIFKVKGLISSINYHINLYSNPINEKFLKDLSFDEVKRHLIMERNLATMTLMERENFKRLEMLKYSDDREFLKIREVNYERDIEDRVLTQNLIFHNKNRVPINSDDVKREMNNKAYMRSLSILLDYRNHPIGYGQILNYNKDYILVNFGIIPDYRGRGFSHYLLEYLLRTLKNHGINKVSLEVLEDNKRGICLYNKHGFTVSHTIVSYIKS